MHIETLLAKHRDGGDGDSPADEWLADTASETTAYLTSRRRPQRRAEHRLGEPRPGANPGRPGDFYDAGVRDELTRDELVRRLADVSQHSPSGGHS